MNRPTILELITAANPVPDTESLPEGTIDVRTLRNYVAGAPSGDDAPLAEPSWESPLPAYRRGWLVAAAAFIAVTLVVGALAAVISRDRRGDIVEQPTTTIAPTTIAPTTLSPTTVPPTSQPPATTQVPVTTTPVVDPTAQAAIDSFVATFNAGNPEATIAALSPNAQVWTSLIAGTFTSEDPLALSEFGPLIERWLRYLSVQRTTITLESCSAIDDGRVRCRGTFTDAIVEASPLSPASLSVTFAVGGGGEIEYFFVRENEPTMSAAYQFFGIWLDENYPGEDEILYDGTGRPSFLGDAIELWSIRVDEWVTG